ncbi:MAG TPA: hypothetical protein VFL70_02510, partial [Bacteroidia bacterium]|nr:hypothetical protein [Bacteroidia bacterium]
GFYFLIGMLLYIFRNKWVKVQVANSFIAQVLKHDILKRSGAVNLLKQLVEEKEIEYKAAENLLKENLHLSYESLKPTNIIKNAFNEIILSPDLKTNLINTIIGYTSGVLTKKAFTGNSRNIFKNLSGIIIEKIVANGVIKNADRIKTNGRTILRKIINRLYNPERV